MSLEVNKNDQFFISLGKKGIHSYVFLGVINPENKKPFVLAKVGKTNKIDPSKKWDVIAASLKMLVYRIKATVQEESYTPQNINITKSFAPEGQTTYCSYQITYQQYLEFINLIALSLKNNHSFQENITCYQPENETDEQVTFEIKPINRDPQTDYTDPDANIITKKRDWVIKQTSYLNIENTCRNTAINIVSFVRGGVNKLSDNISRYFFRDLPLKAVWKSGVFKNNHFYVLPLPPTALTATEGSSHELYLEKRRSLRKIYRRMEDLIKKAPEDQATIDKFTALTELYNNLLGKPEYSIDNVLSTIAEWRAENDNKISKMRDQSFFGKLFRHKSSTEKMIEKIQDDFQSLKRIDAGEEKIIPPYF